MMTDFSKLDLAFIMDTTSSMGSYISNAKKVGSFSININFKSQ
jgi:hypothetical protein